MKASRLWLVAVAFLGVSACGRAPVSAESTETSAAAQASDVAPIGSFCANSQFNAGLDLAAALPSLTLKQVRARLWRRCR